MEYCYRNISEIRHISIVFKNPQHFFENCQILKKIYMESEKSTDSLHKQKTIV